MKWTKQYKDYIIVYMHRAEAVVLDCTLEEAWQSREARAINDANFQNTYELPVFELDPNEVYERLNNLERTIIPNGDYDEGTATIKDDILVVSGTNGVLLTAEHATNHFRIKENGVWDKKLHEGGIAAIGKSVANDTHNDALIAIGRQTGDANRDESHILKEKMAEVISLPISKAHLSLHGMSRAHASSIRDKHGFSVLLGLGSKPSDATMTLKDAMCATGQDLGLRIGVNKPHLKFDLKNRAPILIDGTNIMTQVYSAPDRTTRGWAQMVASKLDKDQSFAAIQVEISDVLRVHPWEEDVITFPSKRDRAIGAYLGYHFVLLAAKSAKLIS
jgi:hypothetical protein